MNLYKKIDKLILEPFLGLFALALASTLFIIVINIFLIFLSEFIGKGLGTWNYILLSIYVCIAAFPHALPLAIMFASIVSMGNLGETLEITALKASGVPLSRIMRPLIIFGAAISIFAFFFNSYIVPKAAVKSLTLLFDMRKKKPDVSIKDGVFYDGIPGYSIRIGKKNKDTGTIHDVMIYDHTRNDNLPILTIAQSGSIFMQNEGKQLVIELIDGHNYSDIADDNAVYSEAKDFARSKFKKQTFIIGLDTLQFSRTKDEIFAKNRRAKNRNQLKQHIIGLEKSKDESIQYLTDNFYLHLEGLKDYNDATATNDNNVEPIEEKDDILHIKKLLIEKKSPQNEYESKQYADATFIAKNAIKQALGFKDYIIRVQNYNHTLEIDKNSYELELLKMFTWALSCTSVMLIGASLGVLIKKGGLGIPLIIAGFLIVIHYVIEIIAEKWAKYGMISTINGAWAPNYAIIPLGIFFYILACKDTRILELDFYYILFDRFKRFIKSKKTKTDKVKTPK